MTECLLVKFLLSPYMNIEEIEGKRGGGDTPCCHCQSSIHIYIYILLAPSYLPPYRTPPKKCAKLQYCPEGYMSGSFNMGMNGHVWVCKGGNVLSGKLEN